MPRRHPARPTPRPCLDAAAQPSRPPTAHHNPAIPASQPPLRVPPSRAVRRFACRPVRGAASGGGSAPKGHIVNPFRLAAAAAALALLSLPARAGCAGDPAPCALPEGNYEIELPPGTATNRPAVLFIHGYGSSGKGTMSNRGMVDALLARGYAVIAPTGVPMTGRDGSNWSFHPDWPKDRDDIAFIQHVRDDAASRFGLDKGRMLLAGFSVGGSMVSYLACAVPGAFPAYAPISGGFWRPHPDHCAGPVRLLHTHGWVDTTVPLEGRVLHETEGDENGKIAQGDIFRTLEIWRAANGCTAMQADTFDVGPVFWRRAWHRCTPGSALEFALFAGDHMIPPEWADMALDWFEALPPR